MTFPRAFDRLRQAWWITAAAVVGYSIAEARHSAKRNQLMEMQRNTIARQDKAIEAIELAKRAQDQAIAAQKDARAAQREAIAAQDVARRIQVGAARQQPPSSPE
jgi:hypothetical protein